MNSPMINDHCHHYKHAQILSLLLFKFTSRFCFSSYSTWKQKRTFLNIFCLYIYLLKHFKVFFNSLGATILGFTFGVRRYFESF